MERRGLLPPPPSDSGLPVEVASYIANSYPHNHNYTVQAGRLVPRDKLRDRFEVLRSTYPKPLESLLDLSCSKGYFVLDAAAEDGCCRAVGIDIDERELNACRSVSDHLEQRKCRFEHVHLHEIAHRIRDFGGPFQIVLLINCYQYLYFGSLRSPMCYRDHDRIFELARQVCAGRVLFSNRTEIGQLQRYCRAEAARTGHSRRYTESAIYRAASRYFHVTRMAKINGMPFWTLDI